MLLQPAFGALSDRIGRRRVLLSFGVLGFLAFAPTLYVLSQTHSEWVALACLLVMLTIVSGYTSVNAIVKAELFPAHVRALGVALPYALTLSLFGGPTEYFALWLKQAGLEPWFFVSLTAGVSAVVYWLMPDTRESSRIDRNRS